MKKLNMYSLGLVGALALSSPSAGAEIYGPKRLTNTYAESVKPDLEKEAKQYPGLVTWEDLFGYEIIVEKGDRLEDIANKLGKECGKGIGWEDLYKENRKIIGPDPDTIRP
ncbi:MAG: LysM peptidoglycan-binding domain-containing protein, partial [Candidatus Aenigmarchaeota archaeon]|nr:LysM peptidoglycan-binding domain-containing protein [Candidatus Aenigmarchaeota archaeon]